MRTPKATAFGSFGYGWQQLWKYFLHLFLIGVVVGVVNLPALTSLRGDHYNTAGFVVLGMLATVYALFVAPVVSYGGDWLYLRFMRDERPNVADLFAGFKQGYLNIVLANLLVYAICGIGFLLFFVPGIIFACRLGFVPYLVMDKGLDPVAAIEKSWFMTRGHGWRIFGMYLLSIVLCILGLFVIGVGAIFALMWASTAFASLYHAVDLEDQARLNQNGVPA
ncbi:MAG TPA: hypothetical protein VLI71_01770 [Gammaproteobacteria bacterium]|nr:hypothetical protein [Gammaproteobacteria bacterium]